MNILVLAPHPDDEAIGCGGTLRRCADRGDRITVAFLTSGELGLEHLPREAAHRIRESEATAAAAILGITRWEFLRLPDWFVSDHIPALIERLVGLIRTTSPTRIYLPHPEDNHPDHRAVFPATCAAIKHAALAPELLAYEVWTPLTRAEEIEDVSSTMHAKLRAIRCYQSQLATFRYDRAARGLAQYRGALHARCAFAEAFECLLPSNELTSA